MSDATGIETYDIVDQKGNLIVQLVIDPADVNIVQRYTEVIQDINKAKMELRKGAKKTRGKFIKCLEEANKQAFERIDYLLGADVAKPLLSVMGAFSPMPSGQFFVEYILEIIGGIIDEEIGLNSTKQH